MSALSAPSKALLFMGVMHSDEEAYRSARKRCEKEFGAITAETPFFPFSYSSYYANEMGADIKKCFWAFGIEERERLVYAKIFTDRLERAIAKGGNRRVNLDPGHLHRENAILATGKNFSHRIYLSKGVYADLALMYRSGKGYMPFPWTYPDYQSEAARSFFETLRKNFFDALG